MKKIRILRIIGECKTGGTETIALNYYKNIDHDKIKMDFLFYGDSLERFDDELKKYGDKVYNVDLYSKHMIKSIIQIKEIVKENKYDIVHSQLNALNFFPLLGAKLGGAKIRVASNHSTANLKYEKKKSILKYLLRPTCAMTANHYAACSKYAGKWAFGNKKNIKIIHNAIDLSKFRYSDEIRNTVRKKENWNDKFVIGHVGRFVAQKNHKFIIDVFSEVLKRKSNSILILIGEGELEQEMKKYVKELGIEKNVFFYGVRFDVHELLQGMDIFLFPSLYEGLGNVITEAQAVSLQSVVSTAVPKEVKQTEFVEFVELNNNVNEWVDTVLRYSNNYRRRDTYNDLVEAGYEIKSAAKDLEDYYLSLVRKENEKKLY